MAAQRTVALIQFTETDVLEKLEQARIRFINLYGVLLMVKHIWLII